MLSKLAQEGRVLLNDFVGWGWDAETRLYAFTEEEGELIPQLVHKFSSDPVMTLLNMLRTGHFTPKVKGVGLAVEAWRHPTIEEMKQSDILYEIADDWMRQGREPIPHDQAEAWMEEMYPRLTEVIPPAQNKYRVETKIVALVGKEGERIFLSVDRNDEDRVTVYDSTAEENEADKLGGGLHDVLEMFLGPKENPSE